MKSLFSFLLLLLGLSTVSGADSWALPTAEKYCSENQKYCLKVQPKKLGSQLEYFSDKVAGKKDAGAIKGLANNFCRGTFVAKGRTLWNVQLDNEVAPVSALISNTGDHVITFDNWHGVGYGDNVVAIYSGQTGTLIKKLGLADFLTESDIYNLPASTSSIHWHGTHQIDYEKGHLVLKVVHPGKTDRYFDIRVNLSDGKVLDEIKDRIPSLQFVFSTRVAEGSPPAFPVKDDPVDCHSRDGRTDLSTAELTQRIIASEMPSYTPAAKAVRATGESVFEILISPDGDVNCVIPISGHPLLRATLLNAIKKWKFVPSPQAYMGRLVIEGRSVLVINGNIVED